MNAVFKSISYPIPLSMVIGRIIALGAMTGCLGYLLNSIRDQIAEPFSPSNLLPSPLFRLTKR